MKRWIIGSFLCAFFLAGGAAFADTVMLYTQMRASADSQNKNVERYVAIEDGVMALFFDSGHIIFDTGLPQSAKSGAPSANPSETWAAETAKTGGASYLLEVELSFPDAPSPSVVPTGIHYKFLHLSSGRTIAEGSLVPQVPPKNAADRKTPYDLCYALGQEVARDVLRDWKQPLL